jgi:chromate transporter
MANLTLLKGPVPEVLGAALRLGLSSFGGPIAHLGYFERTYVRERNWVTSSQYAELVSLCQILPGPTSSQVSLLIGLHRAGWLGALAAWLGFTLPSALLMYASASYAPTVPSPALRAALHGLMLTAVVVVAQAVWSMSRTLAPDLPRRVIAIAAGLLAWFQHGSLAQFVALGAGVLAGLLCCRGVPAAQAGLPPASHRKAGGWALALFVLLLAALGTGAALRPHGTVALANVFYRSGAFVFGGGHVVLPLLQQALVPAGWMTDERFLAGYGLAQAMPGPLFSVAAYLGAAATVSHPAWVGSLVAVVAIFLPGMLLAIAGLALFKRLPARPGISAALAGVNAAVVGLLGAALYDPVWVSAVRTPADIGIIAGAFLALQRFRAAPLLVTAACVAASVALSTLR